MLKDSLYTIQEIQKEEGSVKTSISIDAGHEIFKGHFPSMPVVPGVCMVQIVKELLTETVNLQLVLKSADHLKFLTVINPKETKSVRVEISYSNPDRPLFSVNAAIVNDGITYFKFRGVFTSI